jgi:flagellar motor switch protein FliM
VALRPLTDIEEGVLTYVLIETLKILAPTVDASLPKLRLESVCRTFDEAVTILAEDEHLAMVQLKATVGAHVGFVRLFIPESVLSMAHPATDATVRRARRSADATANANRLEAVKVWLRAEIGQVEISAADLGQVHEGDVILVDSLTTRPDRGEPGTASVRLGAGRTGALGAEVAVTETGRYAATITEIEVGQPVVARGPADEAEPPFDTNAEGLGEAPDELTNPVKRHRSDDVENPEGADLLNDIPLQIAVELGRVAMTAEEVVGLKVGHVIDLNRAAGEPLDLSVNGKVVARGELVEVDGNLGVRILSLAG